MKQKIILMSILILGMIIIIPVVIFFINPQPSTVKTTIQQTDPAATPTAAACQNPPQAVTNVRVTYPNCQ